MTVKELSTLSESQVKDVISLMRELDSGIEVTREMLLQAIALATSHKGSAQMHSTKQSGLSKKELMPTQW